MWLYDCGIPGQQGTGAGHQEAARTARPSSSHQWVCLVQEGWQWDGCGDAKAIVPKLVPLGSRRQS